MTDFLPRLIGEVVGGVGADERRPPRPGRVAAVGVFDLGDVGAEVGERHGGVRSGEDLGQVQHPHTREGRRSGVGRVHRVLLSASRFGVRRLAQSAASTSVPSTTAASSRRAAAGTWPESPAQVGVRHEQRSVAATRGDPEIGEVVEQGRHRRAGQFVRVARAPGLGGALVSGDQQVAFRDQVVPPPGEHLGTGGAVGSEPGEDAAHRVREVRCATELAHAPQHVEGDDVARALPDRAQVGVADQAGVGPFLDVAVAAADLHGLAGDDAGAFADVVLRERGEDPDQPARGFVTVVGRLQTLRAVRHEGERRLGVEGEG